MLLTNLSLYREYKRVTNLLSAEVKRDFEYFDVITKIRRSEFLAAWDDIRCIYSHLCSDPNSSFMDKKRVNELSSKVYSHTMVLIES